MSIRNEIKAQIIRAGFIMQELVDRPARNRLVRQHVQPVRQAATGEHPI